jgi:hypothetical protein
VSAALAAEGAGELADQHLGNQRLAALPGTAELHDVRAVVVRLDNPGQRAPLAQRDDVAQRADGTQRLHHPGRLPTRGQPTSSTSLPRT